MKTLKLLKTFIILNIITVISAGCIKQNKITKSNQNKTEGNIIIIEENGIKIHSYISPENSTLVTSHIIETPNKLVIIDAQFMRQYAKELLSYAKSLNKPIDRIIISHSHPDHWFGLEFFNDQKIYSLKETQDEINNLGEIIIKSKKSVLGELVTSQKVVPNYIINEGNENIDGVLYEFKKISNAEAGTQLLIKLPEHKILIAQDLVFNDVHLFLGQNAFDGWIKSIKMLQELKEYKFILPGHGELTDAKTFEKNINYLNDAKAIFSKVKDGNSLKEQLIKKYPDYRASVLLDISNSFLYKN
ncbi:MBL fold metallo-hydrolase [Candidatus Poribacteria bacterium]|nr:MBL fold metallo-hydrolase [Candidatus Poribacteria bacterium]